MGRRAAVKTWRRESHQMHACFVAPGPEAKSNQAALVAVEVVSWTSNGKLGPICQ